MVKVELSHNPFTNETKILVNSELINETSTLYKHRNTPMKDWVEYFLPDLVQHCNDDKISITFHGLQFNYEDLEERVKQYYNREVEITLEQRVAKSQISRLGSLSDIIDEILNVQEILPELKYEKFSDSIIENLYAPIEAIIISGNDSIKANFINSLLGQAIIEINNERGIKIVDNRKSKHIMSLETEEEFDIFEAEIPFAKGKYSKLVIVDTPNSETQSNYYYRYIKKAIAAVEKPIIIYALDRFSENNNEEYLSLIAENFRQQGKQNKERFIFISENTDEAQKLLNSDYTISKAQIFSIHDVDKVKQTIHRYINGYSLNEKIRETKKIIDLELQMLADSLKEGSSVEPQMINVDDLMNIIGNDFSKIELLGLSNINEENVDAIAGEITQELIIEFNKLFEKPSENGNYNFEHVKIKTDFAGKAVRNFILGTILGPVPAIVAAGIPIIQASIKSKESPAEFSEKESKALKPIRETVQEYIENQLRDSIAISLVSRITEDNEPIGIKFSFSSEAITELSKLGLERLIGVVDNIVFEDEEKYRQQLQLIAEVIRNALFEIEGIELYKVLSPVVVAAASRERIVPASTPNRIGAKASTSSSARDKLFKNEDGKMTYIYYFYNGIYKLMSGYLAEKYPAIDCCKKVFRENITKIEPVINEALKNTIHINEAAIEKLEQSKRDLFETIQKGINTELDKRQKQSNPSEEDLQKLEYIDSLMQKVSDLTKL